MRAWRNVGERDIQARGFFDFLGKDISKSGAFGKIGILPDRFELELSSMEENNEAKVLARPRVTTLNGNKAELNVTNTVYYLVSQVSADGYPITDYRSFNDGISLELTPTMSQDGNQDGGQEHWRWAARHQLPKHEDNCGAARWRNLVLGRAHSQEQD